MATGNRRGVILPVGWYNLDVVSYRVELSKAGDSTNYILKLVFRSENERFNGVCITYYFSSKAMGFMVSFLEACGAIGYVYPFPRLLPRLRFNLNGTAFGHKDTLNKCIGKTIEVFVRSGEYRGYLTNELTQFRSGDGVVGFQRTKVATRGLGTGSNPLDGIS